MYTILALFVVFALFMPLVALKLSKKYAWAGFLGPAVLSYAFGILLATVFKAPEMLKSIAEGLIPLAIPMLLFPCDVRGWLARSPRGIASFLMACAAVFLSAIIAGLLFNDVPNVAMLAAMFTGTYTGGTPNLMAIGVALEAPTELFLIANASDVAVGGTYLIFVLAIGRWTFSKFLPVREDEDFQFPLFESSAWSVKDGALAFALSILVSAVSLGAVMVVLKELHVAWIFMVLTSLSLGLSLIPKVQSLKTGELVGDYLILVFCTMIGSMTGLDVLLAALGPVMLLTATILGLAVSMHLVLAKLFKIDVDTFLISSAAALYGPAFVPIIATRVRSHDAILTGMTSALVGYALGNYLGMLVFEVLS